jgi:GTP-binding protein SAR1
MSAYSFSLWQSLRRFLDSLWSSLGLSNKQGQLLLLGLDNAGKTTLLHRLRTGDIRHFPPTDRPSQEYFRYGNVSFQAWDLGGHEAVRHLWEDYVSTQVSAVFFMIDATDDGRVEEAAYELDALIGEQLVKDIPVAVLLNKCDEEERALTSADICRRIEYDNLAQTQGTDKMAVFRISVLKGEGYQDAFRWISNFLT